MNGLVRRSETKHKRSGRATTGRSDSTRKLEEMVVLRWHIVAQDRPEGWEPWITAREAGWAIDLHNVEISGFMEQYVELWREGSLFP